MHLASDVMALFQRELQLCRVKPGELVGVLSEPKTRPGYVEAAAGAARALGADVFEIRVPGTGWDTPTPVRGMGAGTAHLAGPSRLGDAVLAGLSSADMVIDLIPETIIHAPARQTLQADGCRILTINEAPDALERMFPPEGIKETVKAFAARVEGSSSLRVVSEAGTEITYEMGDKVVAQYGYADEPGRWDHWPSALVAAYPEDGTAAGTVVLTPGDILFPFKRYVERPVTIRVEEGYVVDIAGELDAFLLRDYLDSWDEPEVYAVSHVGWGLLPRAQWSSLAFFENSEGIGMDGRSAVGNFLFSTGPNRFTGRYVEAHLDIPMHGCRSYLDEEDVTPGKAEARATV